MRGTRSNRARMLLWALAVFFVLLGLMVWGFFIRGDLLEADFTAKSQAPSWSHPFGTDWMGRDMLFRTVKGLSTSILLGICASALSAVIALALGALAGLLPRWGDRVISWWIDLGMGLPHMVLLILISFALGRGWRGIAAGIILTHWMSLARLMRAEVLTMREQPYVKASRQFGKSTCWILLHHVTPQLLPQLLVGLVLLFPHAILHEASITFLGFGLSPEQPAIGIILSESMRYLSAGMWWLAFFPGLSLVGVVLLFSRLGEWARQIGDPAHANE